MKGLTNLTICPNCGGSLGLYKVEGDHIGKACLDWLGGESDGFFCGFLQWEQKTETV
ncbi:MAG: hypothetical protein K2X38_13130 [Gemmataceae bacterium]|nr:hypothetical protein [Gemmataceae bacterium]